MLPGQLKHFQTIVANRWSGGKALELGAMPNASCILALDAVADHATKRIGINLLYAGEYEGVKIVKGNANSLDFADNTFDLVVSNALFEHDRYFWRTLSEVRRVARSGALIIHGMPCFARRKSDARTAPTLVFPVHRRKAPGDYYRFGREAVKGVIMEGCHHVKLFQHYPPPTETPHIIAHGVME